MELAEEVYGLAGGFPRTEEYRLTSQILRAVVSIPANIAEGNARGSRKDYARFVAIARGSAAETETLLLLARQLGFAEAGQLDAILSKLGAVGRMLTALHQRLEAPQHRTTNPQSQVPIPPEAT